MSVPDVATAAVAYAPGSFEPSRHYYDRVLNAHLHPLVRYFRSLTNAQLAARYCHLHPEASAVRVTQALSEVPTHFRWAGADLFHATTERGNRRNVVVETNSSPSGQKSMPFDDAGEMGGYETLIARSFLPSLKRRGLPSGALAVLSDKNATETTGYAAAMAELSGESVWWVPWSADDPDPPARFDDGLLSVRDRDGAWHPVRAALKYVTQRPWTRIPPVTRTFIYNPTLICLAGGRNKLMAAKAYDLFNSELDGTGLTLRTPETIWDVSKREVPLWVERMGGVAVVKVPYANAGQGVFTITNAGELAAFMETEFQYDLFVVQALIGNIGWSSRSRGERLYHVGTVPNRAGDIYAADLRLMIGAGPDGWFPVAVYARRAREPLAPRLEDATSDSWSMLGTNLSVRRDDGSWATEPERLLLMDARDFNRLGVGLDDLTEAYIQSVLAATAIDRMAQRLLNSKGAFRRRMFQSLNPDDALGREVIT